MARARWNFAVDLTGLALMLAMIWTGLIIRYILPPGSGGHGGGPALVLWGLDRHDWGAVHFWLSVAVVALLALHVVLHWSWVCGVLRGRFPWATTPRGRVRLAVATTAVATLLVGGATWLASGCVGTAAGVRSGSASQLSASALASAPAAPPRRGRNRAGRAGAGREEINGQMTLREVARGAGISVARLKTLLGLPPATASDERLGRLRRRYGLEISQVRRLLAHTRRQRGG